MARRELWNTTRWSLVRRAVDRADVEAANRALTELIEAYREPIEASLKGKLRGHPRMEDALIAFWGWIFERRALASFRDDRKFRASMLRAIDFYAKEWKRAHRMLGGIVEDLQEPDQPEDAEDERSWASAVLERSLKVLAESSERGAQLLERRYGLRGCKPASPTELEAEFDMKANAINQSVDRARRNLRAILFQELEDMTGSEEGFEEERDLLVRRLLQSHPSLHEAELSA